MLTTCDVIRHSQSQDGEVKKSYRGARAAHDALTAIYLVKGTTLCEQISMIVLDLVVIYLSMAVNLTCCHLPHNS